MRTISNSTGFSGYGETSWEAGDSPTPTPRKRFNKDLIQQANTVPLTRIFKYYGLQISAQNRSTTCPFKSHKGGKERSPSFHFYPESNSFKCYGGSCGIGGKNSRGSEFVAAMDNISRTEAARKIINLFSSLVDPESLDLVSSEDFSERMKIMMDFSNTIREFRQTHLDEESQKFIEDICWVYDQHNRKREHTNEALGRLADQLKERVVDYASDYSG